MSSFFDRVLDLDTLSAGAEGVRFAFERPLAAYLWVAVAAGCVAGGALAYRRLSGASWLRWLLAGLRAALLLLLAALLAGPSFERQTESTEPDWVLVLLDRSESMMVADSGGSALGERTTRDARMREALESARGAFASLGEDREVRWFGVGEGAYELAEGEDGLPILGEATARRTRLRGAIGEALARAAARPIAGMLVVSDGRSSDTPTRALVRPLLAAGAPLHAVTLGAPGAVADVSVRRVSAPEIAYQDDPAPVVVELVALGEGAGLSGRVRLVDEATGEELASEAVRLGEGVTEATVTHRPEGTGPQRWVAEFVPDEPDLVSENNRGSVALEIIDRPVRVLYLDGYPRWEQRYLRNLLIREDTVESANLMLAADRRYLQEGDVEIVTLPASPEEWASYDVVVLGDLDPGVLTAAQIDQIRLFVADEGGGLVWIAGESDTPRSWWSTPLAALIPFTRPVQAMASAPGPVQARPSAEAARLGVLRLGDDGGWPAELEDPGVGWSAMHWSQRVDAGSLKPSTSVLASAAPISGEAATPLVMTMRYGAGRVVYVATDETWRWRYGRGEVLYERFWIQLLRLLGRERLIRGDGGFRLTAAAERVGVGEPLPLTLEITDQSLLDLGAESMRVRAEPEDASLNVESRVELVLKPTPGQPGRYTTVWTPPAAGGWRVVASDPVLQTAGRAAPAIRVEATLPGGELSDPRPDHELLRALADMTGGRVMGPDEMASIGDPGVFPSRRVRRVSVERETLWDTPLALALVVMLAGMEWIGRRVLRVM